MPTTYVIRDLEWWGPVEAAPRGRMWRPWRGLDIAGPLASEVVVTRVQPSGDIGQYVMRTGRYRGTPIVAVPLRYLRTYGRGKPLTDGAKRDRQAVRILLASLSEPVS